MGFKKGDPQRHKRLAALLLMDADNGEILAVAGAPHVQDKSTWRDLAGFDAVNPAASPLLVQGLQHRGDNLSLPGSTFKLFSALLFEERALKDGRFEKLLAGVSRDEMDRLGTRNGYNFNSASGCYPHSAPASTVAGVIISARRATARR